MLSNTATPKYYGEFRERVLAGEIPVNEYIADQMNRIDRRIRSPDYYYDDEAIEGFIRFCENELTKTDGSPVEVLDSFKLWAEDLLAWFYYVERDVYDPITRQTIHKRYLRRLTNKQYLIVGRGAAKSMYAAFLQIYWLVMDRSTKDQIATSPTIRQTDETLSPIRTALVRARGFLLKALTAGSLQNTTGAARNRPKVMPTKIGIQNFLTNSKIEARPMRVNKLQGARPKYTTVDEWLSGDTREDVVGAIEQGASKILNYVILLTSSEGCYRNGIGDDMKQECIDILKGKYQNEHVSIWYYRLDDVSEVAQPAMWLKANPNLGVTVEYDVYQADVERMEAVPATKNDILAKRFGIPTEGYTYFFPYRETLPSYPVKDYHGMPCSLGSDLSQGDDFCGFTFLFPHNGVLGIKVRSYITEATYDSLRPSLRSKYKEFIEEGSLIVMDRPVLDLMAVYDDLYEYIATNEYDVRTHGYDPYFATAFVERWGREFGEYGLVKVPQGVRTESVPLGEIKQLSSQRLLYFDQQLMSFCMGNAIALQDNNGNRKLYKKRREEKIDNVAALLDAYIAYTRYGDMYE